MMTIRPCLVGPLLLVVGALIATGLAQKSPQFTYPQSNRIMLSWDDVWEAGVSNKLAFLNAEKKLTIRIKVEGGDSGGRRLLLCKCSDSSAEITIDLSSVDSRTQHCEKTMPFTLSKVNEDDYQFTLLESKLGFSQAFTHRIELTIKVEFSNWQLKSNSLFVHNLDAISKFGVGSPGSPGVVIEGYSKRYLTPTAINFLVQMNMTNNQFDKVPFIEPQFIDLIKSAPDYIRAKINIGTVLQFDTGDCKNFQAHLTSFFVNYYSKMYERNLQLLKHMSLSLEDGNLYYSTYGLSTLVSNFFLERNPKEISICTLTSFAGQSQPYNKVDEVKQRISKSQLIYKQSGSMSSECSIVGSTASKTVNIFAGMDNTPLVCPIICANPSQPFSFYHGESQLVPDGRNEWTEVTGIRISKSANVIEFPPELFNRNSGQYRCEAGGKKFIFDAKIVSMPQFKTTLHDINDKEVLGDLPQVVFAMENETLSYSCTVYYTNMLEVTMLPKFYSSGASGVSQSWREFNKNDFNQLFGSPDVITSETLKKDESLILNLTIPRVPISDPSKYLNFTHRVVCDASVHSSDAQKVGLPSYSIQSGSNVFFLKRPTMKSFNMAQAKSCSEQRCSNNKGGYFEVSIQPELSHQLATLGVEVKAFFKVDKEYLANIQIINEKNVSETHFDTVTNRLVFRVYPIRNENVLVELQKRKVLTPVFNFRYKEEKEDKKEKKNPVQNLVIHKERYGQHDVSAGDNDCRADALCFYSTDFDVLDTLSGLSIELGFIKEIPEVAPATANFGLIAGIALAVLIVLIAIILLVLLLRRDPGQTYMVDEKERQQGNNPELEAKDEQFKDYQRPEEAALNASRLSLRSNVSVVSRDDQELDAYRDDELDFTKFTEEGSFIGEYASQDRKHSAGKHRGDN